MIEMTLKKAYQTLIITINLMIITVIFYALDVTKLDLTWGMTGFAIATVLSLFSVILAIHTARHSKEVNHPGFLFKYRFEFLDWLTFLSVSLMAIFMFFMFVALPSDVKHSSMNPTLSSGDRVVVYHFNYTPKRNDIVVSYMLDYIEDEYYVKRIFGMPGDQITFVSIDTIQHSIWINGKKAVSTSGTTYLIDQDGIDQINESITNGRLNDDFYIILGDNANGSTDSRSFGAVHEKDIVGKVIFRLWPLGGVS
jgi:signal peptidase I